MPVNADCSFPLYCWTDIDFANRRMKIDESNSSSGLGETKSAKVHYVPLSNKAIEYLKNQTHMLEEEMNPILYNEELRKELLVFPNQNGTMIRPDSFYTMVSRFSEKAGIKASPHCLRHTFVYLNRDNMSLKYLQAVLGHDKSTTTLDIYGDILNDSMISTAAKINDVFDKVNEEIVKSEREERVKKERPLANVVAFRPRST